MFFRDILKRRFPMTCSERIRELREDTGINQTFVAGLLTVSQKSYSDMELGKVRITIDNLLILAKYYNVSLDYISGASNRKSCFPKQ